MKPAARGQNICTTFSNTLYVICSIFLSSHLRGRELKLQLKKCNGSGTLKIVICVSRPKSVSFSFEAEFSGRGLKTGEDKRHFLAEVHIRRPHELQSKRHHWKNYKFILYLPFSNTT
jgi:hypothetical protein